MLGGCGAGVIGTSGDGREGWGRRRYCVGEGLGGWRSERVGASRGGYGEETGGGGAGAERGGGGGWEGEGGDGGVVLVGEYLCGRGVGRVGVWGRGESGVGG